MNNEEEITALIIAGNRGPRIKNYEEDQMQETVAVTYKLFKYLTLLKYCQMLFCYGIHKF
jgi:hypothetical protein